MKDKKILTLVIAVAGVLVLVLLLFPLLSRLIFGRSQAATLFMLQFGKSEYYGEESFREFLEDRREENRKEYELPEDVELTAVITRQTVADVPFIVLNDGDTAERIVFYFPGGSYIDPPAQSHWEFLDALSADLGCTVVVPLYLKLPDNDASASYAAMTEAYTSYLDGLSHGEIIFMGDSAGGGYALSFAMQLRDAGLEGPEELVLICPWVDVTLTNPNIPLYEDKDPCLDSTQLRHLGALWAGDLETTDPVISPLYGSFDGLGHIMLFTGTAELLYPDIQLLSDHLSEAGVEHTFICMKGMFHGWPIFINYHIPESTQAYDAIVEELLS